MSYEWLHKAADKLKKLYPKLEKPEAENTAMHKKGLYFHIFQTHFPEAFSQEISNPQQILSREEYNIAPVQHKDQERYMPRNTPLILTEDSLCLSHPEKGVLHFVKRMYVYHASTYIAQYCYPDSHAWGYKPDSEILSYIYK